MAASTPRFDRMVPAVPDAIGALRRELRRWVRRQGGSAALQANVALAFSEACTSMIAPRYAEDAGRDEDDADSGPLILQAWLDGEELLVRVSHRSHGAPAPPPEVGYGFGIALIARLCDRFEVRRRTDQPGTALLMAFTLEPAPVTARSFPLRPSRSSPRR